MIFQNSYPCILRINKMKIGQLIWTKSILPINGALDGVRTRYLLITNQALYQLSYKGFSVSDGIYRTQLINKNQETMMFYTYNCLLYFKTPINQ